MKKKIAVIGANSFQNPLILRAKELGYETHVFAWKCGDIGEKNADFFYPVSITEKDTILAKCREIQIDAITTVASDLAAVTVNYIAGKMHLPGNSMSCTLKSTNKYMMRQAFRENQIPTPRFEVFAEKDSMDRLADMQYPIIVKPTDRSGSRAIYKVETKEQLLPAIELAINSSFEKKAIVEEYIPGQEFSMEGITWNGEHYFLCATRKATTGAPHFIETGHMQPAGITAKTEEKIKVILGKALTALEITNSATHSEFKITPDGEIRIIEIGARMGGDCIGSDLVQISTGYDFLKMVIDVAMGEKPSFKKVNEPKMAIIRFIMEEKNLDELERIKRENPEILYHISEIDEIGAHKVLDSSTRYGYFILACDNKDKIRWLLNEQK